MTAENKVRRRGAWLFSDEPVYRYITVRGPVMVAWCGECGAAYDWTAERLGQPCPAPPAEGCQGRLVKRVGHFCLECVSRPFLPHGAVRPHIQAFHGQ